jgi:flagellar hook-associated protein 1 FlgK
VLASDLSGLFNSFQDLSTSPSSITNRQAVIFQAQQLTAQFNQLDQRLTSINGQLNQSVQTDIASANQLLSDIAGLNNQIAGSEAGTGAANDLRDLRQQKIESLSQLVNLQSSTDSQGDANLSVGGQLLVSGGSVQDTLQAYDSGGGQLLVRTASAGTSLTLTSGSIAGTIDARDGALKSLHDGINNLAAQLISQVNTTYRTGYDLNGNTGADFFTGTNASDIGVNAALANDPSSLQASGVAGAAGNNQVALALAQMTNTRQGGLGNQTFAQNYNGTITELGTALSSVNSQLSDQQSVQTMLQTQRSAVSGVSIDEEMTNLVTFQRAFQASAHLVSVVDQMLNTVVTLGQ